MNNADERTNMRVANIMNMKKPIQKAIDVNSERLYPYIFLDKTNQARVSGIQIYTDLFSRYKQIIFKSMVSYIISESDFRANFEKIDNSTAVKNANSKSKKKPLAKSEPAENESDGTDESKSIDKPRTESIQPSAFRKRKQLERQVKQALRRYKIRSKL